MFGIQLQISMNFIPTLNLRAGDWRGHRWPWQSDSSLCFLVSFRIMFPRIPHPSRAAAVLSARILEAAGGLSQWSAAAVRSRRWTDAHWARCRKVRGRPRFPQLPGTSWSLCVFRTETWLLIVFECVKAMPMMLFKSLRLATSCTHHKCLFKTKYVWYATLQISGSRPFRLVTPLNWAFLLATPRHLMKISNTLLFQPKRDFPPFNLLILRV